MCLVIMAASEITVAANLSGHACIFTLFSVLAIDFIVDVFVWVCASSEKLVCTSWLLGALCQQVCVKTSPPPTSSLRALNSCHKVSAIAQACGGAERLPVSHLSVSVVSPVSHTLCLFTGPEEGTIEVCLVTHHISYGVWSPVEGGGEAASARPSGLAN